MTMNFDPGQSVSLLGFSTQRNFRLPNIPHRDFSKPLGASNPEQ